MESAVNEIVAKRMNKAQQIRWNRATVQPFLDVRTARCCRDPTGGTRGPIEVAGRPSV